MNNFANNPKNQLNLASRVYVNGSPLSPQKLIERVDNNDHQLLGYPLSEVICVCPSRPDFPKPVLRTSPDDLVHGCCTFVKKSIASEEYLTNSYNLDADIIVENPADNCIRPSYTGKFKGDGTASFITGSYEYDKERYQDINVVTWPHFWFSGNALPNRILMKPANLMPTKLFVCMNNKIRPHRDVVMKAFIAEELINPVGNKLESPVGNYSYVCRKYVMDLLPDDQMTGVRDLLNSTKEYYEPALFDVIVETDCIPNNIRWTEKTVRAIYAEKPFFILSEKNANKKLFDEYGFKRYPFIDYLFDELDTLEERAKHVAQQLAELTLADIPMIWKQTREIAAWNRERMFDIVQTLPVPSIYERIPNSGMLETYLWNVERGLALRYKTSDDSE